MPGTVYHSDALLPSYSCIGNSQPCLALPCLSRFWIILEILLNSAHLTLSVQNQPDVEAPEYCYPDIHQC